MSGAQVFGVVLLGGAAFLGWRAYQARAAGGAPQIIPASYAPDSIGAAKQQALTPQPAAQASPAAGIFGALLGALGGAVAGQGQGSGASGASGAADGLSGLLGQIFGGGGAAQGGSMGNTSAIGNQLMTDLQSSLGLTKDQAAGIVGNLSYESGGFRQLQEVAPTSGAGGYGYAQWTGSRRTDFLNWSAANGLDPSSYQANLGFLVHELTTTQSASLDAVKSTSSAQDAAVAFQNWFERPGIPNTQARVSAANAYAAT